MGGKRIQSIFHQLSNSQRSCSACRETFIQAMYLKVRKYGGDNPRKPVSYVGS